VLVHVPEYSPARPETVALQAPFQDCSDLLADHPPCIRTLPPASWSIHAPVAPPVWSVCAVQLPPKYPVCEAALQVPLISAPGARTAAAKIAKTGRENIVFNLSWRLAIRYTTPRQDEPAPISCFIAGRTSGAECSGIDSSAKPANLRRFGSGQVSLRAQSGAGLQSCRWFVPEHRRASGAPDARAPPSVATPGGWQG